MYTLCHIKDAHFFVNCFAVVIKQFFVDSSALCKTHPSEFLLWHGGNYTIIYMGKIDR